MSIFENIFIAKNANIYFDGKVTSRSLTLSDGSTKTLGIMMPGEDEFGTEAAEVMDITQGKLEVLLPDSDSWQTIQSGELFNVPANSSFKLKVHELTDYCCSYIK